MEEGFNIYELIYKLGQIVVAYYLIVVGYQLVVRLITKKPKGKEQILKTKSLMVVFGSGGHTTEMLLMLEQLKVEKYKRVEFVLGHSDTWSMTKIQDFYSQRKTLDMSKVKISRIFRAREVK